MSDNEEGSKRRTAAVDDVNSIYQALKARAVIPVPEEYKFKDGGHKLVINIDVLLKMTCIYDDDGRRYRCAEEGSVRVFKELE